VIKPITVAIAIDAASSRTWPALSGGAAEVAAITVHDRSYGASLNIPEALIHSSNIVLAQVGDQIGARG
jgi:cell division protein FtsI (penicillin-binding protein 3)